MTGVVDVLARGADGGALVVDYKSDRLDGAEPEDVVERDYATQRIVYALAALRDGAPEVEVAYAFLERPDAPVSATFTPATSPRSPSGSTSSRKACSRAATRSPPSPTARCAATARAARPCARGPRR